MSDTKYWRIRRWVLDLLESEKDPLPYSELVEMLDRDSDKFYAGMVTRDLMNEKIIDWRYGMVSLLRGSKEKANKNDS